MAFKLVAYLILCIKLYERIVPFPVSFLNALRVFEKAAVLAPGQIKFSFNNFECLGFYAGSPAEH